MSEEVEKHILRKYEIAQKLGKGVRGLPSLPRPLSSVFWGSFKRMRAEALAPSGRPARALFTIETVIAHGCPKLGTVPARHRFNCHIACVCAWAVSRPPHGGRGPRFGILVVALRGCVSSPLRSWL